MNSPDFFPPTRAAALDRIAQVRPDHYARSRNAIDGAVTRLSPYVTHGFVSLPEVLAGVAARHQLDIHHKFVFELGWREFFHHVWQQRGEGILQSLHEGVLPDHVYQRDLPGDIREARTGLPVIDLAVRTLYSSGYLHNHARMWLASYVVHIRKVHWRAGADWMVAHLFDGDLASNHLSWQWVAGTGSNKPYLFNAENVARYAPAEWHSPNTVIDASYETLDALARSERPVRERPGGEGVEEPALFTFSPVAPPLQAVNVSGRDLWLVHPWALDDPPTDPPDGCLRVSWMPAEHHSAWPWSAARWAFVGTRMAELAPAGWACDQQHLAQALMGARSVQSRSDPHVAAVLPAQVVQRAPRHLFAAVRQPCTSFSSWWNRSTKGLKDLAELPSLASAPTGFAPQFPRR